MDHCRGIDVVIERGTAGEVYNIGGGNEVRNVDLTHMLLRLAERPESLIKKVQDRQGHDLRYSLDTAKLRSARLAAAGSIRARAERHRSLVPRQRVVVAPD